MFHSFIPRTLFGVGPPGNLPLFLMQCDDPRNLECFVARNRGGGKRSIYNTCHIALLAVAGLVSGQANVDLYGPYSRGPPHPGNYRPRNPMGEHKEECYKFYQNPSKPYMYDQDHLDFCGFRSYSNRVCNSTESPRDSPQTPDPPVRLIPFTRSPIPFLVAPILFTCRGYARVASIYSSGNTSY